MFISSNNIASSNADIPILVTDVGINIDVNEFVPLNALSSIIFNIELLGIVIVCNDVASKNVPLPIDVVAVAISNACNDDASRNASLRIDSILLPLVNVILCNALAP